MRENKMGAISKRINAVQAQNSAQTIKNNKDIVLDYQSRAIGSLENLYAKGKITRYEYKQAYAELIEEIRTQAR
jgi:uncharacterized membrane protein